MTQTPTQVAFAALRRTAPRRPAAAAAVALAGLGVLLVTGVATRSAAVRDRPLCGYLENDDATAHVLVTCLALRETPAGVHKFLPLFTRGAAADRGIDNLPGATVRDAAGNHYYTSFPPLGFIVAYLGTGAGYGPPPTPHALRLVGLAVHLALVVVSVGVFRVMLAEVNPDPAGRWLGAVAGGAVLWGAPEMATSYTVSFWAQQVYQLVFAVQLACLCGRRVGPGFGLVCAAGCLTEWTAFVVNAGVVGLGLVGWVAAGDRRAMAAAGWAAAGTLAGGLGLVGWFAAVTTADDYLAALAGRFALRRGAPGELFPDLLRGYAASAGAFLVVPVLVGLYFRRPLADPAGYDAGLRSLASGLPRLLAAAPRVAAVAGLTAWSLAENILCMQHAVTYTFDRVKFVYLLAVAAALLVGRSGSRTLCGCLIVVAAAGLARTAPPPGSVESAWRHLDAHYGDLVRRFARDGEPVFMSGPVRGSKVYYAGRNIIELPVGDRGRPVDQLAEWVRERAAGRTTALVVLIRDEIPPFASEVPRTYPRPAEVYRIDVATGAVSPVAPPAADTGGTR